MGKSQSRSSENKSLSRFADGCPRRNGIDTTTSGIRESVDSPYSKPSHLDKSITKNADRSALRKFTIPSPETDSTVPRNPTFQTEYRAVSYTHLRAHETGRNLVC